MSQTSRLLSSRTRTRAVWILLVTAAVPWSRVAEAGRKIDLKVTPQDRQVQLEGTLEPGDELRILQHSRAAGDTVLFASDMARVQQGVSATLELHIPPADDNGRRPDPELRFRCDGRTLSLALPARGAIQPDRFRFTNSFAVNERYGIAIARDERGQCDVLFSATITRRRPGEQAAVRPKTPLEPAGIWLELETMRHSDELQRLNVYVHNASTDLFVFENGAEDGPGSLDDRDRAPTGTAPTVIPEVTFYAEQTRIVTRPTAFRTRGENSNGRPGAHLVDVPPGSRILYASWRVPADLVTSDVMAVQLTLLDGRKVLTAGYEATHGGPRGSK